MTRATEPVPGWTVNGIEPGYIDTPALTGLKARYGAENIAKFIPAKRLGIGTEFLSPPPAMLAACRKAAVV